MARFFLPFIFLFISSCTFSQPHYFKLSDQQISALGQLIWKNEGQKKVKYLTVWNQGEAFPSLGIGHFIWYPNKPKGPFKEQFPALLAYLKKNAVQLPNWLESTDLAPWKSRNQFYSEFNGQQLSQLRLFLSEHINLQVQFIILRLEKAIPAILAASSVTEKNIIQANLNAMRTTAEGVFSLLDYINFKGEGISEKERYQGDGWGLKQVLLAMPKSYQDPLRAFGYAADEVLTRRVKNATRDESKWLRGWRVRVHSYQSLQVNKQEEVQN